MEGGCSSSGEEDKEEETIRKSPDERDADGAAKLPRAFGTRGKFFATKGSKEKMKFLCEVNLF